MLSEPNCNKRGCKHFLGHDTFQLEPGESLGVSVEGDEPDTEILRNICTAFPDGIPDEIAYGEDLHLEIADGQFGTYTYESVA